MPVDIEKALGASLPGTTYSWDEDDVILYQLGIGAGVPPTEERELRYAYEGDLQVLPTYATVPSFEMMMSLGLVDGLDFDLASVLHGEQELEIHRPIPVSGTTIQSGTVTDIYDKGRGALVILEIESRLEKDGELLFTNRPAVYLRGEGGFGGEGGPSSSQESPTRQADHIVESPTLPQQALLYRIASGDKNPLHADPGFAAFAGFERPILHGLCTFGIVGKAAVDHALDGRPERVAAFRARFSGAVYPGETISTSIWAESGELLIEAKSKERDVVVLSGGHIRFAP
ncbi:MAG TPA: MaoC/PaaZ C-terminal domain-containing protein [Acidimicrobiia bacterium]